MKKIYQLLSYVVYSTCFFLLPICSEQLSVSIKSPYACLINLETGRVLYAKRAHEKTSPASTTKIATALYALYSENCRLQDVVVCKAEDLIRTTEEKKKEANFTLPAHYLEIDGVMINLRMQEKISVKDLMHAVLINSANDAANVLARYVAGSVDAFMEGLNAYCKDIGCQNTHFSCPHGLYHPENYTTAYDMALIAKEAMKHSIYRKIVRKEKYEQKEGSKVVRIMKQSNQLMRKDRMYYYPFAVGGKTGYTRLSGYTLVNAAINNDRALLAVVFKAPSNEDRYQDMITLFDAAFQEKKETRRIFSKEDTLFTRQIAKANAPLVVGLEDHVLYEYYPSEEEKIYASVHWQTVELPIAKSEHVADLVMTSEEGQPILTVPLQAQNEVDFVFLYKLTKGIFSRSGLLLLAGCLIIVVGGYAIRIRTKSRV